MAWDLSDEELRVLGCLIEKDMATPEYYPLSLNALVNACNQKSNRDPMVNYDDETVAAAFDRLRARHLASVLSGGEHRVPKYGHRASETLNVNNRELAVIAVLMLRGPQTLNELKTRTERLHAFDDLDAVESVLRGLAAKEMAVLLPRQQGTREPRWAHLLAGEVKFVERHETPAPAHEPVSERVARLEREVEALKAEFAEFRKQFE